MFRKRVILLLLSALLAMAALTACGSRLSGTYTTRDALLSNSVTFNGDNITLTILGVNLSGAYEIKSGTLYVKTSILGFENTQTFSFEKKGKSIYINNVEYIKN